MNQTLDLQAQERIRFLHGRLRRRVRLLRRVQAAVAQDLLEVHGLGGYPLLGETMFPLYCERRLRLGAAEGFGLLAAAEAFEVAPHLRERVIEGRATLPAAAAVGKVLRDPALLRGEDDWEGVLERHTTKEVADLVKKRREEARIGGASVKREIYFSPRGFERFVRAREVAIEQLRRFLSETEVVELLVEEYLRLHDPEEKAKRAQEKEEEPKAPPRVNGSHEGNGGNGAGTGPAPRVDLPATPRSIGRKIPSRTRHLLIRAFGDRCWVDGCDHGHFREFAHSKAFAYGGGHEPTNLLRLCHGHHRQYDARVWKIVRGKDGPLLVDARGTVVGRLRRPPPS